jgi:hypothetical protein
MPERVHGQWLVGLRAKVAGELRLQGRIFALVALSVVSVV